VSEFPSFLRSNIHIYIYIHTYIYIHIYTHFVYITFYLCKCQGMAPLAIVNVQSNDTKTFTLTNPILYMFTFCSP
jgi:hypothetical protein